MRWLRPEPGSPIRVAFWYFWYRGYRKSQHPPTPSPALTRASSAISADSVSDRRFAFLFDRGPRSASLNPILDRLLRQSLSRSLLQVSPVWQKKDRNSQSKVREREDPSTATDRFDETQSPIRNDFATSHKRVQKRTMLNWAKR